MLAAARRNPHLVTQIVPSPFGLSGHDVVLDLLHGGFIGQPRELHVYGMHAHLAESATPLGWRQDAALSGVNMLTLGILHETASRWVAPVKRVLAQVHAFIPARIDPASGVRRPVGTPDSVQALTIHADGMRGVYQFSGVTPFGPGMGIRLYGSEGALWYDLDTECLFGARTTGPECAPSLEPIVIPPEKARAWQVEADFINAIRHGHPITFTDFATGVRYVEFTEAVARSGQLGIPVDLPLEEFLVDEEEYEEELATGDGATR
jgi:predicted dehydrogenase